MALVVTGLVLFKPSHPDSGKEQSPDRAGVSSADNRDVATAVGETPPVTERRQSGGEAAVTYGGPAPHQSSSLPGDPPEEPARGAGADFAALVGRVTAAGHQPRFSLDAANPRAHEADLCDVGDLAISLAFPSETVPGPVAATIVCLPDGPGAWRLEMRSSIGTRREVGGLAVREGRLVASLPLASAENQAGRLAVAAGIIRITAEHDPRQHTHVQLRRSAGRRPLVFPQLAFDPRVAASMSGPADGPLATVSELLLVALPTPWPCRTILAGTCGTAEADVTVLAEGSPFAGPSAAPTVLVAAWTSPAAPREPFLQTSFTIEPFADDPRKARFRLTGAELPAAWSSLQRFGRIVPDGAEAAALPGGVPPAGLLPPVARLMTDAGGLIAADRPISSGQLAAFARAVARQHRAESPAVVTAPLVFQSPRFAQRSERLATWVAELREELGQARGDAAIPLRILVDELAATGVGKRLAADVVAGLGSGTAVFEGRLETFFPSLNASAVILTIGAADAPHPQP